MPPTERPTGAVRGRVMDPEKRKRWLNRLEILRRYIEANNGELPGRRATCILSDGSEWSIGKWVTSLQEMYQKEAITFEKIKLLNEVEGWAWERVCKWEAGLAAARACIGSGGDYSSKKTKWEDAQGRAWSVGTWTATQRNAYHNGKLSRDRVDALNAVPGWKW
jgi:hypothetical protein